MRVALIGNGFSAKTFHLPLLRNVTGLRLQRVVSRHAGAVAYFPKLQSGTDVAQAWADPNIELVVIATPNDSHFHLARQALLAGKHVVVDKPFTTTVAEAVELVALARECKRLLSVFHDRRWDADFLTVKQILSENRLGEIAHFESHYDRYRPQVRQRWREQAGPGSGIWFDLGPHLADQALQLFGAPQTIYADLGMQREGALTTDYFHVILRYGRRRVILHGGSLMAAENFRFAVHGTLGSYTKYGMDPQEEALKRGETPGGPGWGKDPRDGEIVDYENGIAGASAVPSVAGNYLAYYEGIRNAITQKAPNPVTPEDGLRVMMVLEAATESARLGRELPYPAALPATA